MLIGIESVISHHDTADIPVLMLANKQDLPNSLKVEEIQQAGFTRIAEALSARDSRVLPISALTGDGVKDAIDWLYLRLQKSRHDDV
jgi:ADP-ribosylation factor related protein 1